MKVFISSVTHALRDARTALSQVLDVVEGFESVRFEDFLAQDRSPRDACLTAVESSDVYVLLLGPKYGEPSVDTGLAPTEEEFAKARRLGRPTLVFNLLSDEDDEARQATFKKEVGDYVNGRFWAPFSNPQELNVAVLSALREVTTSSVPLTWERTPADVEVAEIATTIGSRQRRIENPTLYLHLLPIDGSAVITQVRLKNLADQLANQGRQVGFFPQADSLDSNYNSAAAWAITSGSGDGSTPWNGRAEHTHRGIVVLGNGQVTAWEGLPTDMLGTLVNESDLQRRLGALIPLSYGAIEFTGRIAFAAEIKPFDSVALGDPATIGSRNSGSIRIGRSGSASARPELATASASVPAHAAEIAAEIAARIVQSVRDADRR